MKKMFLLFVFALILAVSCDKESGLYCPDGYSCWQKICEPDGAEKYRKIFFVDTRTGWRIGYEGLIMKTSDGGYHWTFQDSLPTPSLRRLVFNDENTGWIAGDGFWKTTNGGHSWKQCAQEVDSDYIVDLFFLNKKHGWALGRNGSVYKYGY